MDGPVAATFPRDEDQEVHMTIHNAAATTSPRPRLRRKDVLAYLGSKNIAKTVSTHDQLINQLYQIRKPLPLRLLAIPASDHFVSSTRDLAKLCFVVENTTN